MGRGRHGTSSSSGAEPPSSFSGLRRRSGSLPLVSGVVTAPDGALMRPSLTNGSRVGGRTRLEGPSRVGVNEPQIPASAMRSSVQLNRGGTAAVPASVERRSIGGGGATGRGTVDVGAATTAAGAVAGRGPRQVLGRQPSVIRFKMPQADEQPVSTVGETPAIILDATEAPSHVVQPETSETVAGTGIAGNSANLSTGTGASPWMVGDPGEAGSRGSEDLVAASQQARRDPPRQRPFKFPAAEQTPEGSIQEDSQSLDITGEAAGRTDWDDITENTSAKIRAKSASSSSVGSPASGASPRPSLGPLTRRLSNIGMAFGRRVGGGRSPDDTASVSSSRGRRRSVSSELKRVHPLIRWLNSTWQWVLEQRATRFVLTVMADHRFEICAWLGVMVAAHTAVTTFLVLSLSLTMPGIWVYNFVQLFVICLVVLSNVAGRKISQVVRLSITASDLLRGTVTILEMRDYWSNGKYSPAHTVSQASGFVELCAEIIIVACSILYSWEAVPSHVLADQCVPPDYTNSSLPENVNLQQFLQGEIDFATIDNFGLPLSDGLIGGWPLADPLEKFSISNECPVYLIEVLCDDGILRDDLTTDSGTTLKSTILSSYKQSVMFQTTVLMPAGTVVSDSTGKVIQSPFEQHCTIELTIGHGICEYSFVADEWLMVTGGRLTHVIDHDKEFDATTANSLGLYASQGRIAYFDIGDPFNVTDIVVDSVTRVLGNGTYYPSDGGAVANALRWAARTDGFYHSDSMFSGVAAAAGAAANFALMQYSSGETQACDYYGYVGAGRLTIPEVAVIAAAVGSAVAITVKVFEILWWALTAVPGRTAGYARAGRALRHPVRFAVDSALMLGGFVADRERDEDLCQASLAVVAARFGLHRRVQFGEDVDYVQRATGHVRIGEYGKVCAVQPDRKYGTLPPPPNVEFANLTEY
ncbi:hypothetical protein HK405_007278 [Cladochytrium tenue]|nr:hypothetical protein HK405_007278 [Cladochytrium tenue]